MEEQEYICKFCQRTIKKSERAEGWQVTKFEGAKFKHQRKGWKDLAVCVECDKRLKNPL